MGKLDERRTRNLVGVAFAVLVLLYTVKLSFPGHSVHTAYTAVSSYIPSKPKWASASAAAASNSTTSKTEEVCPTHCMPISSEISTKNPTDETLSYSSSEDSEMYDDEPALNMTDPSYDGRHGYGTKAAVIIENRPLMSVIPLIMHFSSLLGEGWPIIVYTKAENIGLFSASAVFNRLLDSGRIELRTLPLTVLINNSEAISNFLTEPWFWESLAPAEHILIFQSDSMLCSNAAVTVDDFLEWDFIGAPIAKGRGAGYNGGLSLRRRSKILEVISKWDFSIDPARKSNKYLNYEDQWFFHKLRSLEGNHLPSMEVARTFSVETVDYPNPLGVHQVHRWQVDNMEELDVWCPEYKLCATDFIKEGPAEVKPKFPADHKQPLGML